MEVSNPKHLLAVNLTEDDTLLPSTSLAGSTVTLRLETNYYKASVPVWLDLVAESGAWTDSFLSDEAAEVLAALGGLVIVLDLASDAEYKKEELRVLVRDVGRVVGRLGGWEWDGVRLVVAVGDEDDDEVDEWDQLCLETGFEFVHVDPKNRLPPTEKSENRERSGIARVKEALEANEWESIAPSSSSPNPSDPGTDLEDEDLSLGLGKADLDALKQALWSAEKEEGGASNDRSKDDDDDDDDDENESQDLTKLEFMMRKLQAVRLAGSDMSDDQRRKVTAEAVAEVMRQL
ncbi:hypothetical protein CP532_1007 [Ophiocordyceps camponoti-leonardi (nom. inval.)]|nr:hypothetical protein CP532_1007 [Ophiocordyceps camponoti-leonardi (nom. inval.)]